MTDQVKQRAGATAMVVWRSLVGVGAFLVPFIYSMVRDLNQTIESIRADVIEHSVRIRIHDQLLKENTADIRENRNKDIIDHENLRREMLEIRDNMYFGRNATR